MGDSVRVSLGEMNYGFVLCAVFVEHNHALIIIIIIIMADIFN